MRNLVIGDVHFGVKTNNVSWLESQKQLFEKQIFDIAKNQNIDRIIFVGDLFDIRYAINQQIGIEVKNIIRKLAQLFKGDIIFVAGNHDYYSPVEEFYKYNAYELVFGPEFVQIYKNVKFVNEEPYLAEDGSLFLPWYYTENPEHFDSILYNYDFTHDVKAIYCHADLQCWPGARITSLRGVPIYSGHIHYLFTDEQCGLYNIGAVLALTFGDVNQDRYLYIIEDHKIVDKIKNVTTPKFIRIFNEDIFSTDDEMFENSYIQLCIFNSNINKARYIEQIKYLKNKYVDSNIRLHVMDDTDNMETLNCQGFNTNINEYIEQNIPDHLNDKYNIIKEKLL